MGGDEAAAASAATADAGAVEPLPFGHSTLLRVGESKLFAAGLVAAATWCYVTAFVPLGAPKLWKEERWYEKENAVGRQQMRGVPK